MRISKSSYEAGFRLKHIGEVMYAKMLDEFGSIVDKVQVTIITDKEKVEELLNEVARPRYAHEMQDLLALQTKVWILSTPACCVNPLHPLTCVS